MCTHGLTFTDIVILPTECFDVFRKIVTTNSDYLPVVLQLVGFYNRDGMFDVVLIVHRR